MMTLLFEAAELEREARSFIGFAGAFLYGGSSGSILEAVSQLRGITRSDTGRKRWAISATNPVLTMPSVGDYQREGKGELVVFGEITFAWDLEPVRDQGDTRPAVRVKANGVASTCVRILEGLPENRSSCEEVAVWRMEVADSKSPGTFFHVQILGRDGDSVFPKSLDIPRLPGVLNSPFACMEFVIGELFQDGWARASQRETGPGRQWRGIQARRHTRHLDWARELVSSSSGSPWSTWKKARPGEEIFLT